MVALATRTETVESHPFERRVFARVPGQVIAEARRIDHSIAAHRNPRLTLEVRDVSVGGLSALSEQPVDEGERVIVRFPPRIGLPRWDAFGRVVRCEPSALGYHVAVEFDALPAA